MGADGIVGVTLTVKHLEWDKNILEFVAIGTGVVHATGQPGYRGENGHPFTSDLSGQDFWTLLQAGYRPLALVMGSCVYHVAHQALLKSLAQAGRNVEMTNFSQALYDAREIAMERMQHEAMEAGAEGVVGMDLHEGSHNWQPHVIEFFAVGTAVVPTGVEKDASALPDPQLVLSVNNEGTTLMSLFGRIADLFQAKTHSILNALEDPNETLELSYEKMLTGLQETKRHMADVVAQQQLLHRQIDASDREIAGAEDDARTAVGAGRDDLARAALVHKREVLSSALSAIAPQVEKLVGYQQRLQARIEQFRTEKETMKASYAAAQAQVKVTRSLTGIGQGMGGVGDTLRRADAKVQGMRDKADAMDGLIRAGVLEDPLDARSPQQRELAAIRATNAVMTNSRG